MKDLFNCFIVPIALVLFSSTSRSSIKMSAPSTPSHGLNILIIGAGLTGLLLAQGLKQAFLHHQSKAPFLTRPSMGSVPQSLKKSRQATKQTANGPWQSTGPYSTSKFFCHPSSTLASMKPTVILSQALWEKKCVSTTLHRVRC